VSAATLGERVLEAWELAWNQGEPDALDLVLAPDYVRTGMADARTLDRDGMKRVVDQVRRAFPDLRTTVDECVESSGALAVRWHCEGTHLGDFYGAPPTGKTVHAAGASFFRAHDGAVVAEVETWDPRTMLSVLGIHVLGSQDQEDA
jgi:steroid delta-isomerase-like uncharacterized protein